MRSAYDDYREASEALDAIASRGPIDISRPGSIRGIESLAAKQRIEFEKYIEKRIEYSEFVRERSHLGGISCSVQRAADDSTVPNHRKDGRGLWLGGMTSRIAVGAALLCMTVFILHEQRRIHDLDAARDEPSATVNHTGDDHQSLSRQPSASGEPNQLASPKAVRGMAASLRPHPKSGYRNARHRPVLPPQNRITIQSPKSDGRSYYWFTLTPSTQFKQVGRVGLSLRKDPKRRYFDLCLKVDNSKVERRRVKLDAPIRIITADRLRSASVVVTRIEKNSVRGYLSEPSQRRPVTTATDQARQRIRPRS